MEPSGQSFILRQQGRQCACHSAAACPRRRGDPGCGGRSGRSGPRGSRGSGLGLAKRGRAVAALLSGGQSGRRAVAAVLPRGRRGPGAVGGYLLGGSAEWAEWAERAGTSRGALGLLGARWSNQPKTDRHLCAVVI